MTPLHSGFRNKLLAAYDGMENTKHEPQLTQQDLEKYDTLVSKRHLLHLVRQGELAGLLKASFTSSRNADEAIDKELQCLKQDMHCTLSDCMPDFHAVHHSWSYRNETRELYKADCAYSNRLRPFAVVLGIFMLVGIISLFAMMP